MRAEACGVRSCALRRRSEIERTITIASVSYSVSEPCCVCFFAPVAPGAGVKPGSRAGGGARAVRAGARANTAQCSSRVACTVARRVGLSRLGARAPRSWCKTKRTGTYTSEIRAYNRDSLHFILHSALALFTTSPTVPLYTSSRQTLDLERTQPVRHGSWFMRCLAARAVAVAPG